MSRASIWRQLLTYYQAKFRAKTWESFDPSLVLTPTNVIVGETYNWDRMAKEKFPRLETVIWQSVGSEETGTLSREVRYTFNTTALIKREKQSEFTEEDFYGISDFIEEVQEVIYSAHNDVQMGINPCDGFMKIEQYPRIDVDGSISTKVVSATIEYVAVVSLEKEI